MKPSTTPPLAAVPDPDQLDEIFDMHQERQRGKHKLVLPKPEELLEKYPNASKEYVDAWYEIFICYESAVEDVRHEGRYSDTPSKAKTGAHQRLDAFCVKLFDIAHKSLKYRSKNSAADDAVHTPPPYDDHDDSDDSSGVDEKTGGTRLFGFD